LSATVDIATWNLRCTGNESTSARKIDHLAESRWDVACLQEVNGPASMVLADRDWSVVNGLDLASKYVSDWKNPHGAVVVSRNGWVLGPGDLVTDTPTPGRGVATTAVNSGERLSVISWHAPNASGEGRQVKMAGYRAVIAAIHQAEEPMVVGLDSNHWTEGSTLDLPEAPHPDDPFEAEQRFFSREPQHRLHDAFLVYLRKNRSVYERIVEAHPDGPLAVTYVRGSKRSRIPDRFDYLMVSEGIEVIDMDHDYEGGISAGSDHAVVSARLLLGGRLD
jgi:endonuclease/exonuclease/phosphatase family metal-dependent hydrolase